MSQVHYFAIQQQVIAGRLSLKAGIWLQNKAERLQLLQQKAEKYWERSYQFFFQICFVVRACGHLVLQRILGAELPERILLDRIAPDCCACKQLRKARAK